LPDIGVDPGFASILRLAGILRSGLSERIQSDKRQGHQQKRFSHVGQNSSVYCIEPRNFRALRR
jgi:hypothetical protein